MQPRGLAKKLVMTPLAKYEPAKFSGKNESGIRPIGERVLILPDVAPGVSEGGVIFTDQKVDSDGTAAETGVLVAMGDTAWEWNADRTRPFSGTKPTVGQRVWFERYAGAQQYGKDGRMYCLMDDKCVGALAD